MNSDTNSFREAACAAIIETLENLLYEEIEIVSAEDWKVEQPVWAKLLIRKPIKSNVYLYMSAGTVKFIAETLLEIPEKEISEDLINDTVAELINTLAGRILDGLPIRDKDFELGLPETGCNEESAKIDMISIYFQLAENTIRIAFQRNIMSLMGVSI